jgi:divalent metal cation (Fe/Co/Zn/Cd) transporter
VAGSALYVLLLLAMAAAAVVRLFRPQPIDETFAGVGAALQALAFMVDASLWWHNRRIAKLIYSPVMELQWRTSRSDALCSLAVALSLAITLSLSQSHAWAVYLDPVFSLAYITFAIVAFCPSLLDGVNELADKTLQEDLQLRIDRRLSEHFHGYLGFHGVRSRRSGGRIFIEVALSFSKDQSFGEVENTVERLTRDIEADIPGSEARVCLFARPSASSAADGPDRHVDSKG